MRALLLATLLLSATIPSVSATTVAVCIGAPQECDRVCPGPISVSTDETTVVKVCAHALTAD
jgi:hypothetical protein